LDLGLIGLPGSGKTAVLRLLTGAPAGARTAVAQVPDPRLDVLAAMFHPRKVTRAAIGLTELTGLVPGRTARAEANAVLDGARRADALLLVIRCFGDPSVPHPLQSVQPERDARALVDELILADLERVEAVAARLAKSHARKPEEARAAEALAACQPALEAGRPLRQAGLAEEQVAALTGYGLLTLKPMLLAANLDEADLRAGGGVPAALAALAAEAGLAVVPFCAAVEEEIAALDPAERAEFLAAYGLSETGAERLARSAYAALGLISFLTAGEDEVRAWPIRAGTRARQAAGKVHSDIERGFIRAEVASWEDLRRAGSWRALREAGRLRIEGKDYVVQDGDVIEYRFNV
jgi:GTP-binding protein YchF